MKVNYQHLIRFSLFIILITVLLTVSCGGTKSDATVIHLSAEPNSLNPTNSTGSESTQIYYHTTQELINADYNNIELRFLRLTIQDNVPAFLGYNQNIKEDKDFLYNQLNNITDKDLRKRIISYLSFGMAKLK